MDWGVGTYERTAVVLEPASVAADDLLRVVPPGGTIVITSWVGRGAIADVMRLTRDAVVNVLPEPLPADASDHLDWGDPDTLRELFGPATTTTELTLPFTAASPRAWIDEQDAHHPSWAASREVLDPDRYTRLLDSLTDALAAGNEDPAAFLVTGPYLLIRATVPG